MIRCHLNAKFLFLKKFLQKNFFLFSTSVVLNLLKNIISVSGKLVTPLTKILHYKDDWRYEGLFRIFFRAAVPNFKSGAKAVVKQLFHLGVNIINVSQHGENVKLNTKQQLKEAVQSLMDKATIKLKSVIDSCHPCKSEKHSNKIIIYRKAMKVKACDMFG